MLIIEKCLLGACM